MPPVSRLKWRAAHAKNRAKVMRLRGQKKTMEQIAAIMGISRQRVSQIIAKESGK